MPAAKKWTCPTCKRTFARARQNHSCDARPVAWHFRNSSPALIAAFDALVLRVGRFGPVRVDAAATSIHFISDHAFAGVTVRREFLRLSFLIDAPIDHARIERTQRLGPKRVEHAVKILSARDVDATLLGWLHAAYRLRTR